MAVSVDYYALLKVSRDADKDAVEAAVKKSMREWRKRTEAADLSVRQEAELKVKQIEEARVTLLNQAKRAAYDRDLAAGVKEPVQAQASADSSTGGWLDQAESFLGQGDYHSAAYAARQATQAMGDSARSWWVRSRANAGLNDWQAALYEARQAVSLEENNADYAFHQGAVHESMGQYSEAINLFHRADSCDPSNPTYQLAIGGVHLQTGSPEKALPIIEAVYKKHPEDENANFYLGSALMELAERVPSVRDSGSYIVTSAEEISRMRDYASRARNTKVVDRDIRRAADEMLAYLAKMEEVKFRPPRDWAGNLIAMGGDMGCAGAALGIVLTVVIVFLPVILLISGFAAFGDGNGGLGFLLLLGAGASGYWWWKQSWQPEWKHAKRDLS